MTKLRDTNAGTGAARASLLARGFRGTFLVDALHLAVLTAFAVAQPLLDLLGRRPEFFAVRRSQPIDLWCLVVALCLLMPLPLVLIEAVTGLVGPRFRRAAHGVFCAALVAAILLPPLDSLDVGPWTELGLALIAGVLGALALDRWRPVRLLLAFLVPALVVFPAVFLLRPGVGKILRPAALEVGAAADSTTPVVLLVFDELPLISLLSGPDEIDAVRYPHFAALAARSTWYRHTAAASDFTILAVPAIFSGRLPDEPLLPIAPDYPQSLFTLLGDSYAMNVSESVTQVCPASLCVRDGRDERNDGLAGRLRSLATDLGVLYLHVLLPAAWAVDLPPVNQNWMLFAGSDDWQSDWNERQRGDRVEQVADFVDAIQPTQGPVLHMLHVLLPHPPFDYLPTGKRYSLKSHVVGLRGGKLPRDSWAAVQNQQRHLLQLGFVDRLLGDVVARLEKAGLWDRAVVVVTADHGVAFRPGGQNRKLGERNVAQILSVPLLIKAPGQREGVVDERPASVVDVLPTIADLAGIDLPWPVDGVSLAAPGSSTREHFEVVLHREAEARAARFGVADVIAGERAALDVLDERFPKDVAAGRDLFRIGVARSWIGRRVAAQPTGPPMPFQYSLRLPTGALDVASDSPIVPAHLFGRLVDRARRAPVRLAVAVNGRIAAVTRSWRFQPDAWSAVVDPDIFRAGANSVDLYALERAADGDREILRPVPSSASKVLVGLTESGLHGIESWDVGPVRWTDGDAQVTIPVSTHRPPHRLRLTIAGTKPEGSRLRVTIDGSPRLDAELEEIAKDGSWSTDIDLSGLDLGREMTVRLVSDSFVPSELYETSTDDRRLGVAILGFELLRDRP